VAVNYMLKTIFCWVSALNEPMRWPRRQEDVSLWSVCGLIRAVRAVSASVLMC